MVDDGYWKYSKQLKREATISEKIQKYRDSSKK